MIQNTDHLIYRVHKEHYIDNGNDFSHNAFRIRNTGMSCHWAEKSSSIILLNKARNPLDNKIVIIPVGEARKIPGVVVVHDPKPDDNAHSEIRWNDKDRDENERVRYQLKKISKWAD